MLRTTSGKIQTSDEEEVMKMAKELTGWKCKGCGSYQEIPVRAAEYTDKINLAECPVCHNKTLRRFREILEFD